MITATAPADAPCPKVVPWCGPVRLRPEVAAQHDAPAPREAVDLLRHARCWPGLAGSTPARWGCHGRIRRDQRPGTTAGSTAPLAMLRLPGAALRWRTDHGHAESFY